MFTPEIADQIISTVIDEIAASAANVKGCADAARAFAANGNRSPAVEVLLDVEVRAHELKQLVEVVSFVGRRAQRIKGAAAAIAKLRPEPHPQLHRCRPDECEPNGSGESPQKRVSSDPT